MPTYLVAIESENLEDLSAFLRANAPPIIGRIRDGRLVKIRCATQVATRPPTFALFVSQADALPGSYIRYLANSLRETFDFDGVPLRLLERTGKNPYAKN
jgi:GTP-binding protein